MASEEDEKELELKDLIIQTLEANGILPKLKAQIRASVFSALDESEKSSQQTVENPLVKKLLTSREGRLTLSLVYEFLDACNLDYTLGVFEPEINAQNIELDERSKIAKSFDIYETEETKLKPLLFEIVKSGLSNLSNKNQATKTPVIKTESLAESVPKDLTPSAIAEARKKFERYDKDKNGIIDKNEFRDLFVELFPAFNKNMLERYVNDEFNATDKNLSSGIDFEEFKSIYKRWFSLCRSVVLRDNDNDDDRSEKSDSQSTSILSGRNTKKNLIDVNKLPTTMNSKNDLIDLDEISSSSSSSSLTEKMHKKGILDKPSKSASGGGSLLDDEDFFSKKPNGNAQDTQRSNSSSSASSAVNKADVKTSLKGAPSLLLKPASSNQSNLKDIDKKIKGLGIGDYDEDNYDDDFTSGTTPRTQSGYVETKRRIKTRNFAGSDEEIDENISYAEESSKFDEVTVDKSISTIQGNNDADYLEDLSN